MATFHLSHVMVPNGMGTVYARVTLRSPDRTVSEVLDLVVDTGSLFTWVPEQMATRLGVRPRTTRRFRTIDGNAVERSVGDCLVECEGEEGYTRIVFGQVGDASVLGVTTLEALGLQVDPQTHRLQRVDATLALATP